MAAKATSRAAKTMPSRRGEIDLCDREPRPVRGWALGRTLLRRAPRLARATFKEGVDLPRVDPFLPARGLRERGGTRGFLRVRLPRSLVGAWRAGIAPRASHTTDLGPSLLRIQSCLPRPSPIDRART